jgi:hypothetical protein
MQGSSSQFMAEKLRSDTYLLRMQVGENGWAVRFISATAQSPMRKRLRHLRGDARDGADGHVGVADSIGR